MEKVFIIKDALINRLVDALDLSVVNAIELSSVAYNSGDERLVLTYNKERDELIELMAILEGKDE